MKNKEKNIVSIDVSKDYLTTYWNGIGRAKNFGNDVKGIRSLMQQMAQLKPTLVVLECTGGYEHRVCEELWRRTIAVVKVNPGRVRHFCQAKGYLAKTDPIDAKAIYEFGMAMDLTPQAPPSKELQALKQLFIRRQQIMQLIITEKNHFKAPCADKVAKSSVKKLISILQKELKAFDSNIATQLRSVPEIKTRLEALQDESCVGPMLLAALLILLPEIGTLNRQTVAALAGLAPYNVDSGNGSRKRRIKGGRAAFRTVLYMATLAAIRHNGTIKAFCRNLLKKGKLKMVAITACMRKFLIHLNSVARLALLNDSQSSFQGAY